MDDGPGVDTDIILKCAAWGLGVELTAALARLGPPGVLGVVKLIAPRQLRRMRLRDPVRAASLLSDLLEGLAEVEPSPEEVALAAELAGEAQRLDLQLDAGEAQLAAIAILRPLPLLVTGDKRAIAALPLVLEEPAGDQALVGRVACLEQIVQAITRKLGPTETRRRVCGEPAADGALGLACSCGSAAWRSADLEEAMASFVAAVKRTAPDLLAPDLLLA